MTRFDKISELLPDGLDESTLEKIMGLLSTVIDEQVSSQVDLLEAKVNAFLRTKIDTLKEQAASELEEENELYRNAKLFESVRTLMRLDYNAEDESRAVAEVSSKYAELQEESSVLVEEFEKMLEDNRKLQGTVKALEGKVAAQKRELNEHTELNSQLLEEVEDLKALEEDSFNSSEKALVINEDQDRDDKQEEPIFENEFLNSETVRLANGG